jgi:hypothetical protein
MEHKPLTYKDLEGLLRGQRHTFMANILKTVIAQQGLSIVPCEMVFWEGKRVVIICSLDYIEGATKPLMLRRHSWLKPWWEETLRKRKPRSRVEVIDINGMVIFRQVGQLSSIPMGEGWIQVARAPKAS